MDVGPRGAASERMFVAELWLTGRCVHRPRDGGGQEGDYIQLEDARAASLDPLSTGIAQVLTAAKHWNLSHPESVAATAL